MADSSSGFNDISINDALTAYDRAASHPNPAFDFLTGFVPRKLKDLFKWAEYLHYNSAHISAAIKKFGELVITNIEYKTPNRSLKENYKDLFEKTLHIKTALLMASADSYIYGNHFASFYEPFVRFLRCGSCKSLTNIVNVDYKFTLKNLSFDYRCKACGKLTSGEIVDRKLLNASKINLIRWDPKAIDIEYNPITGQSVYYYNIPDDIKDAIKNGSKHHINTMPVGFLRCVQNKKLFKFSQDAIYHVKVPGPSGISQQWGFPPLASTVKLFLYTMVLRKANEAIALEHIVPFRVMHPAQTGSQDPSTIISLSRWQQEMKYNIRKWRRDPLHIGFAPIAVGVTNVGGDGRALLTLGEVQESDKSIMAAMGIPIEFLYGGLTRAGMEGTIRLIQNQLQSHADSMNGLLRWYTGKAGDFLGWERIPTELTPLQIVDDPEAKQLLVQLATSGQGMQQLSMGTLLDKLGIDINDEREKRKQEQLDEAKLQQELQKEIAKMQSSLSQQVSQQMQGQQGLNYDQQAVIGQAEGIVQQLMGLDEGSRKSQLHSLQAEDYVMYSVVIQRLEEAQNAQRQQATAAMQQQPMM